MAKATGLRTSLKGEAEKTAVGAASKSRNSNAPTPIRHRLSREGKVPVTGFYEPRVRRQLRIMAAEGDTTVQALLGEAISDFFAKHGKPEIAR